VRTRGARRAGGDQGWDGGEVKLCVALVILALMAGVASADHPITVDPYGTLQFVDKGPVREIFRVDYRGHLMLGACDYTELLNASKAWADWTDPTRLASLPWGFEYVEASTRWHRAVRACQ